MPNYSYFYVRAVAGDDGIVRTQKFHKGDPDLLDARHDVWATHGRYKLLTRQMRGGLSGSGDVYNPASVLFKVDEVLSGSDSPSMSKSWRNIRVRQRRVKEGEETFRR